MKRIILAVLAAIAITPMAFALPLTKTAPNAYTGDLISETGLTYSTTVSLDVGAYAANRVSAQINYGTATYAASTFTDGRVSTGNITVVSTTGLSGQTLTINRIGLIAGTDYPVGATVGATATNLAQVINASTCALSSFMSAQAIGAVVYTTSTLVGGNFPMASTVSSTLTVSGANMTGGTGVGYSATTDVIRMAAHGFTLGLPLLYSGTPAILGILTGTTYYALPIDADNIYLSTTSALALAGSYIDLTAQHAPTTANTYTLAPLNMGASNASAKWQVSNDGITYSDLGSIATVFISTASASTSATFWDFSDMNYRYLRLSVTGPVTGGVAIKAIIQAKQ